MFVLRFLSLRSCAGLWRFGVGVCVSLTRLPGGLGLSTGWGREDDKDVVGDLGVKEAGGGGSTCRISKSRAALAA